MKILSIRDRLLDYYQPPICAENINKVLAALAMAVNAGEEANEIAQAPHQFEIWQIGEVDDQGHISANKELICNCNTLVRASVRKGGTGGSTEPERHASAHQAETGGARATSAEAGSIPSQAPGKGEQAEEIRPRSGGGY